ncbi:carboxy terminal-processing peptidase [Leptospira stimsonii]|uniref:PDZ domain-containing protein n=1 Tax=Leptospira stimsonii TaxID=2202203 RepID=A0A396YRI8_9LEPT|nr:carboxy terminal-processing peptidase [Leptospira stimsonii]RHX85741.1 hypothetical protein DLM75_19635 [Leptospira stimsonii]
MNPLSFSHFFYFILLSNLCIVSIHAESNFGNRLEQKTKKILSIVAEEHYLRDSKIRSGFSEIVKESFLTSLDPHGIYFTQKDISELNKYDFQIHSRDRIRISPFLNVVAVVYKTRLIASLKYLEKLKRNRLNSLSEGNIEFYRRRETDFPVDEEARRERWNRYFRYNLLSFEFDLNYSSTANGLKSISKQKFTSSVASKLRKSIQSVLYPTSGNYDSYMDSQFLNAMLKVYDPHSYYLSSSEKRYYDRINSSEDYYFGITLVENNFGYAEIKDVIHGSPAWKSANIHSGDRILGIRVTSKNRTLDTSNYSVDEMESFLSEIGNGTSLFKIRKKDGRILSVSMQKEKSVSNENAVTGYFLKGKYRIGYLYLSSFYTNFDTDSKGCAQDIAKEIYKLRKENIQGLILDLRDNDGGKSFEMKQVANIFIDIDPFLGGDTPLFREKKSFTDHHLYDIATDSEYSSGGALYNGPLLILLNGGSASASEGLASILRSYDRAIIVGGISFGKASSQLPFPLKGNAQNSDFIFLTTNMFFNVKGITYQQEGIIPDISLPSLSDLYDKESNLPFSIPKETLDAQKELGDKMNSFRVDVARLSEMSRDRLKHNQNFSLIQTLIRRYRKLKISVEQLPLNSEEYFKIKADLERFKQDLEFATQNRISVFSVESLTFDQVLEKIDPFIMNLRSKEKKQIERSIYIDEAYKIMCDYLQLSKKEEEK